VPTAATIAVMAAAAPIGPGAGSVARVTIHKMTVSTTQTEPIILDAEFMPTTHSPRIDLRDFKF
jgi:thiazole synthase ThiGH ThiG subunit